MSDHIIGMACGDEIFRVEENGDIVKDGSIINDDVNALAGCMLELARNHARQVEKRKREHAEFRIKATQPGKGEYDA